MAASTTTTNLESLKRKYSDQVFEPAYNVAAPFFSSLEDQSKSFPFAGEGFYGPFYLATPQNIGTPAEDSNLPASKQRDEVQWRVRPGLFVGNIELSWVLRAVADSNEGAWNGGETKRSMAETVIDLTKHINRIYAGTHGTGRLCQVLSEGVNTFVAKFGGAGYAEPAGHHLLRPNMSISVYDDDTGSGASEILDRTVDKIVKSTRTVTYSGADGSLDEDDHVYIHGSYGQATVPNGLNGLIDDGTVLTTIHNQSRSTYEELKSTVLKNASSLDQLTEDEVLKLLFVIGNNSGQNPDVLFMNRGIASKFVAFLRPDRRTVSDGLSSVKAGYKGQLSYSYGPETAAVWVSEDVLPRTLYAITKSLLWRFTAKRLDWYDSGRDDVFFLGADGSGYKTTDMAVMLHIENIGTPAPWAHGKKTDLSDAVMCGTQYGGTDA